MSYVTSPFVQAQPTAKIVVTEHKVATDQRVQAVTRKETTTKILLFVTILACLVLAVAL